MATTYVWLLLLVALCFFPAVVAPPKNQFHPEANYNTHLLEIAEGQEPRNAANDYDFSGLEREMAMAKLTKEQKKQQRKDAEFLKAVPHVLACFTSPRGPCIDKETTREQIAAQKCVDVKPPTRPQYEKFMKCFVPGVAKASAQYFVSAEDHDKQAILTTVLATFLCDPEIGLKQTPSPSSELDKDFCDRLNAAFTQPANAPKPAGVANVFAMAETTSAFIKACAETKKKNPNASCGSPQALPK